MRNCDVCGEALPVQTGRGGRRKRHPECRDGGRPKPVLQTTFGTVTDAVTTELAAIGKTDTPEGTAAVRIARRIDADSEPGAALSALVKELRTVLAAVRANAKPVAADPVDELKARRAARANG